jgi:hypothetical protein
MPVATWLLNRIDRIFFGTYRNWVGGEICDVTRTRLDRQRRSCFLSSSMTSNLLHCGKILNADLLTQTLTSYLELSFTTSENSPLLRYSLRISCQEATSTPTVYYHDFSHVPDVLSMFALVETGYTYTFVNLCVACDLFSE